MSEASELDVDAVMESGDLEAMEAMLNGDAPVAEEETPEAEKEVVTEPEKTEEDAEVKTEAEPEVKEGEEDGEATSAPEVIKTANGKHDIPIRVLNDTRKELSESKAQINELQKQLDEKNALFEKLEKSGINPNDVQDPGELTDEQLESLGEYEELGEILKAGYLQTQELKKSIETLAAKETQTSTPNNSVDSIVDADPDLSAWVKEGGEKWESALSIDSILQKDPDFQSVSIADRFAEVVRRTKAMYGEAIPEKVVEKKTETPEQVKAKADAIIKQKLEEADAQVPNSLTNTGSPSTAAEKTLEQQAADLDGAELIDFMEKLTEPQRAQLFGA